MILRILFALFAITESALFLSDAAAEATARFLYLENSSDEKVSAIAIETKDESPDGNEDKDGAWKASGRHWSHAPLAQNEAACFDTDDLYGDVPENGLARLVVKLSGDEEHMPCEQVRVDKRREADLRIFRVITTPIHKHPSYLEEGCHALASVDWQPTKRCSGPGERIRDIYCD